MGKQKAGAGQVGAGKGTAGKSSRKARPQAKRRGSPPDASGSPGTGSAAPGPAAPSAGIQPQEGANLPIGDRSLESFLEGRQWTPEQEAFYRAQKERERAPCPAAEHHPFRKECTCTWEAMPVGPLPKGLISNEPPANPVGNPEVKKITLGNSGEIPNMGNPISPPPEELESVWDDDVAEAFRALRPQQQDFLMAYLRSGNAAEAYRQAYNKLAKDHLASVSGSRMLASAGISKIMDRFQDQNTADLFLIVQTYRDMIQATRPNWVQDKDGQWENVGNDPDWKARKDAADGLAKLRGLNAPDKVSATVTSKVVHVYGPQKKPEGHGA